MNRRRPRVKRDILKFSKNFDKFTVSINSKYPVPDRPDYVKDPNYDPNKEPDIIPWYHHIFTPIIRDNLDYPTFIRLVIRTYPQNVVRKFMYRFGLTLAAS